MFMMVEEERLRDLIWNSFQRSVSVLAELALGHLRYHLTDEPFQSNSPPHNVLGANHGRAEPTRLIREIGPEGPNFA